MSTDGFERFYESEARAVFTAVFLLCRDALQAEEATQEAFARAWQRWNRLGSQPWVGGWVTTTALNVARRGLRRRRPVRQVERSHDPDEGIDLWVAVGRLPHRQQQAVVLYYRLDLPVSEIAEILGCTEGTVRTHLARAREVLRGSLEGDRHGA